jgi:subtilisin family serine protease
MPGLRRALSLLSAAAAAFLLAPVARPSPPESVEVVVGLAPPSLAAAIQSSRALSAHAKAGRLDAASPTSVAYLRELGASQEAVAARIRRAIPSARIRWRYRIVLDGLAVVVPRDRLAALSRIPGVAIVYPPGGRYRPLLDRSPELIGANQLWGSDFATAGQGEKIAILDEGIDPSHPFFDPSGYSYPAGFPKGDRRYTSPKVIVARAFAPPYTTYKYAKLPYDPVQSEHGDHVAGIAAGDYTVGAVPHRGPLSGVAPRAYLGNYKVLTVPTPASEINGTNPEIAAAIEAAVTDGMDVINLSISEPEIAPSRDVVVKAIAGAAQAGVVSAAAAGNSFDVYGRGSIESPASGSAAITAAAASKDDQIAYFSASGPTPISLQFKPDVTAPGVSILSSVPKRLGLWTTESGTSMAAPHVAGAAALLRQRHPTWTVDQIKSALVQTGDPVYADPAHTLEVPATREGGGMIDLPRADNPLVFASPTGLSFGLLKPGVVVDGSVQLTDAGGGAGDWTVSLQTHEQGAGLTIATPSTVTVPGALPVGVTVAADAEEADATGFIVLQRGTDRRRIPYWLRVERPRLAQPTATLSRTGTYTGSTLGKPARVSSYRYPDNPKGAGISNDLRGPEEVFRVRVTRPVANFGVVVLSGKATPRVVVDGDENRLVGYAGLPLDTNDYLNSFMQLEPIAGDILPAPGTYDVVFDTVSAAQAGGFRFRFWVDDTTPPRVQLLTPAVRRGGTLALELSDAGSGVDPRSITAQLDRRPASVSAEPLGGRATIQLPRRLAPGRHNLVLQVSDYQEEKNTEDVARILPNTTTFRATFTVRP